MTCLGKQREHGNILVRRATRLKGVNYGFEIAIRLGSARRRRVCAVNAHRRITASHRFAGS
ncbi:hypothetical protein NK6_8395 [Bradyrhizobium diazoefficiens]|uniref:Uncharacterized protein n=1 Tax=Bradyrhizobium diazoefficiens TaxID=1355477 RepID=A0A0E4BWA1_9BRAD|nr:hypothetical protein NK6_8395 [Bradyrhizobium diazoefficiens]